MCMSELLKSLHEKTAGILETKLKKNCPFRLAVFGNNRILCIDKSSALARLNGWV